eukprot:TRINITY_DN13456_c0_g1_i1.p1 TRINITY_DN13456_c0_g1~~TRINITY_DN13456_c0_g1_i1.p1  ORF type:complete len:594 (-),score=24.38 TRINITY_DN13456_c0_g1_i1:69-1850(-)
MPSGQIPTTLFGILLLFTLSHVEIISAQCANSNPGLPTNSAGVPVCACGYFYTKAQTGGASKCPANFNGAGCYPTTSSIYNQCGGTYWNPRCCCTNGGACCDSYGRWRPSSYMCQASRGSCERNRYCTGSSSGCPANYVASGTICAAKSGPCENDRKCTGSSYICPTAYLSSSTLCQASRGPCENNRYCTGSSAACPSSWRTGSICASASGPCENNRTCTSGAYTCPSSFKPASTLCQSSRGGCEGDAYCSGTTASCSPNYYSNTTVCGAATGACTSNSQCLGNSYSCPGTTLPAGSPCYNGTMPCDAPQSFCDGLSDFCAIQVKPNGTVCGIKTDCPTPQNLTCDGQSRECKYVQQCACPPNTFGLDCSCLNQQPEWLPDSFCRNRTWQTPSNYVLDNQNGTINANKSGNYVVDGDYKQGENSTLIVVPGARIVITGDISLGGSLLVNLSASTNYTAFLSGNGVIPFFLKYGNRSDGSTFDDIKPAENVIPTCKILQTESTYDASSSNPGLLVIFSLGDDPECAPVDGGVPLVAEPDLDAIEITNNTGAIVGGSIGAAAALVVIVIAAVYFFKRRVDMKNAERLRKLGTQQE